MAGVSFADTQGAEHNCGVYMPSDFWFQEGTKWKFKCVLGLPWSPRLSASGGTKHVFNRENRMVQHVESWDIEPTVALRQLVTPGKAKK